MRCVKNANSSLLLALKRGVWAGIFALALTIQATTEASDCRVLDQGSGWDLRICEEKLKVLKLHGTPVERARITGKLLKESHLNWDVYDYFNGKVAKMMETSPKLLQGTVNGIYANYSARSYNRLPASYKAEVEALSKSSGKSLSYFKKAFALPDFGTSVQGFGSHLTEIKKNLGCTSVGILDDNGRMSFGRNLDFSGVGSWDKNPLLVVNIPESGSQEIPHIALGADGMNYGSVSGLNQAGIGLVVHLNVMRDGLKKMENSMYFVGEEVLRKAHTIDEAIAILNKFRTGPQWAYVISDFNSGKMATVEVSEDRFYVRWMKGKTFAQSNHVANPDAIKDQVTPFGFHKNSRLRFDLVHKLAGDLLGKDYELSQFIDILGYQRTESGELSSHSDILKAHTIQSVAFDGAKGLGIESVWLGFDQAPTATGRFGGFQVNELFSFGVSDSLSMQIKHPSRFEDNRRAKQMEISEAYELITEKRNPLAAIGKIKAHQTSESYLVRATLLYGEGRYQDALQEINLVATHAIDFEKFSESKHLEESLDYVKALALIQLKHTAAARELARKRIEKGIEAPFYQKRFDEMLDLKDGKKMSQMKIHYDFFAGDVE